MIKNGFRGFNGSLCGFHCFRVSLRGKELLVLMGGMIVLIFSPQRTGDAEITQSNQD